MAALVLLAGGLSAHAQAARDLRPSDTETDGLVHEQRQFGLRLLLHKPSAPDSLQRLLCRNPEITLCRASWLRSWDGLTPLILLGMPALRSRLTLPPWHVVQPARRDATIQVVRLGHPEHESSWVAQGVM
jgi:hypothetical protein